MRSPPARFKIKSLGAITEPVVGRSRYD